MSVCERVIFEGGRETLDPVSFQRDNHLSLTRFGNIISLVLCVNQQRSLLQLHPISTLGREAIEVALPAVDVQLIHVGM